MLDFRMLDFMLNGDFGQNYAKKHNIMLGLATLIKGFGTILRDHSAHSYHRIQEQKIKNEQNRGCSYQVFKTILVLNIAHKLNSKLIRF